LEHLYDGGKLFLGKISLNQQGVLHIESEELSVNVFNAYMRCCSDVTYLFDTVTFSKLSGVLSTLKSTETEKVEKLLSSQNVS